ncbi:MAG: metallophosphoesterase family protein [Bacilli bacterium]|nr:metallophosphoesterase family protein [Bacilli bacterium]
MALTPLDKINLKGIISKSSVGNLHYCDLYERKGKSKYNDSDLILFFIEMIKSRIETSNNVIDKMAGKYLHCVGGVLAYNLYHNKNLSYEVIDQIRDLQDYCTKLIGNGAEEDDEFVLSTLGSINALLIDYGMAVNEVGDKIRTGEPLLDDEETIVVDDSSEIEDKVKELEEKVKSLEKELKSSTKQLTSKDAKIEKLNSIIADLKKEIQEYKAIIKRNNNDLKLANKEIVLKEEKIQSLTDVEKNLEDLNKRIILLQRRIDLKDKTIKDYKDIEQKQMYLKQVEEVIVKFLSIKSLSLDELCVELKNEGFSVTREEVHDLLIKIKNRINILSPFDISIPHKYRITSPVVKRNCEFNFDIGDDIDVLDVVVLSDLHLYSLDKDQVSVMDNVYDYCSRLGINIILNLGDFSDYNHYNGSIEYGVKHVEDLIGRIVCDFPKDDKIVHAILGGNHDENLFQYGIDILNRVQMERNDFVNLGYEHASIKFSDKSKIMLHHMDIKVPSTDGSSIYDSRCLVGKVASYYKSINKSRDDYYIDLLGHFHRSGLDIINGIGVLPSLYKDRECNGAWHLRVYFDKDKGIKHIVVIPLVYVNRKIITNGEINYQKLVLK